MLCLLGLSVEHVPADGKFCKRVPTIAYMDHSGPQLSMVTNSASLFSINFESLEYIHVKKWSN